MIENFKNSFHYILQIFLELLPSSPLWITISAAALVPLLWITAYQFVIPYLLSSKIAKNKSNINYNYEQRKKHKETITKHKGKIIKSALSLSRRIQNLNKNIEENWMCKSYFKTNNSDNYYFTSTVRRFLKFFYHLHSLESEAIVLDRSTAEKEDRLLLQYIAMFNWVMTDVGLFEGTNYNPEKPTDHLFIDHLRKYRKNKNLQKEEKFSLLYLENSTEKEIKILFDFFECLERGRKKWERIQCLQIILISFINNFGDEWIKIKDITITETIKEIKTEEIKTNLRKSIELHKLEENNEVNKIYKRLFS